MLMSKHCSSIYFRRKITVLTFTLSNTVMLLLTDFTSAPDDKSIGIKYCQNISIAITCADTQKVSPTLLVVSLVVVLVVGIGN